MIAVLLTLVLVYIKYGPATFESFSKNVPPGPKPWPIIGSLHLMATYKKYPFEVFTRLQKVLTNSFKTKKKVNPENFRFSARYLASSSV